MNEKNIRLLVGKSLPKFHSFQTVVIFSTPSCFSDEKLDEKLHDFHTPGWLGRCIDQLIHRKKKKKGKSI